MVLKNKIVIVIFVKNVDGIMILFDFIFEEILIFFYEYVRGDVNVVVV